MLMLVTGLLAQSEMISKTTITVDKKSDDGTVTQEKYVLDGDSATAKLKELESDPSVVNVNVEKRVEMTSDNSDDAEMIKMEKRIQKEIEDIEKVSGEGSEKIEKRIEIRVDADDSNVKKKYKIKINEDGQEKVMEWEGDGEMPEEIKKHMRDVDHEIIIMDGAKANIINKSRTNGAKVYRYDSSGNVITSDDDVQIFIEKDVEDKHSNGNRAQMGVMIEETIEGVKITEFIEGSPAKEAGMRIGDIITKVDDVHIATVKGLVQSLSPYEVGDKIKVKYVRNGKEKKAKIKLAKR